MKQTRFDTPLRLVESTVTGFQRLIMPNNRNALNGRSSRYLMSGYAGTSFSHLAEADSLESLEGPIMEFFDELVLRWIECMSLLGKLDRL